MQSTSFKSDEHKSDTDSGRSSIHGEKEIIERILINAPSNKLHVTRCTDDKLQTMIQAKASKVDMIGMESNCVNQNNNGISGDGSSGGKTNDGQLLVSTNRKNHILKKRNLHRRNTIEFSHLNCDWQLYNNLMAHKRTTATKPKFVDNVNRMATAQMHTVGASMPGINILTLSNIEQIISF